MTARELIKMLTPPLLVPVYRSIRNYGLSGDYHSWDEAVRASTGYESDDILEKTKTALLKVKSGQAVYERDSVLFDEVRYAWPLLAGLMWIAAQAKGKLHVLDFGGSLGSTYFQNRVFLCHLPDVRWSIVEQAGHVKAGKEYFQDEHLRFYSCVEDCLAEDQPNVVLFSGVLQYLERPYAILDQIRGLSLDYILIDRTPFWAGLTDRLCVQTVPPKIYAASYPVWIFSTPRFLAHWKEEWRIMVEFDSLDRLCAPVKTVWRGLLFERRKR